MPKRSTKPVLPVVGLGDPDLPDRGRPSARMAAVRVEQLEQRFDDYTESNDKQMDLVRDDVREVRDKVDDVQDKIDGVVNHVGNLRVDVAKLTTVTESISAAVTEQQKIKTVTMIAEVETSTAARVAQIDDTKDAKKARRALLLRIAVVIIGLLGTAAGMLIEHYR